MPWFTVVALLLFAATAGATDPYVDTAFTPTTPRPDPDLVIVRELFYGAAGVDLSSYGLGGPHTYVQSLYFRLFADNDVPSIDSFTGLVLFPPEITILGFITEETPLGGSNDDGQWTQSDLLFGIGGDPDRYSEEARGFETGGGISHSEFIGLTGPQSFVFGLNITSGVDDFRVIIDYGDAFGEELSFDILAYDIGVLGGAVPTVGIRVGDDLAPTVFGSGDYGETASLLDVPLTSTSPAVPADALPFDPLANLYLFRDGGSYSVVDGYETTWDMPLPDLFVFEQDLASPVGITDGNGGLIYGIGAGGGFAVINPVMRTQANYLLADLSGANVAVTNLPGHDELFLARDTSGSSFVDVLDVATHTILANLVVTAVTNPVDIADGPDVVLYVLDGGGMLGWLDAAGGNTGSFVLAPPGGSYAGLTGLAGSRLLFLVRDTGGDTAIDTYDVDTQQVVYGHATFPIPGTPIGITDGPDGHLYVLGAGGGPAGFTEIDPASGTVILSHSILDFEGFNVALTNLEVLTVVAVEEGPGLPPATFAHLAVPNPFNARVEIRFELAEPTATQVSLYDLRGRLVRSWRDASAQAGWRLVSWDGRDEAGQSAPSGTYLYRVQAGERQAVGKVELAK
jgi:hypothetical protein